MAKTGDNLVLTASVSDNNITASQVSADFSGIGGSSGIHPVSLTGGVATWTSVPVNSIADGIKTVTVDATDSAGNNAIQKSVSIELDNTIPVANADSLTTTKDTAVATSSATLAANDTDSDNDTLAVTDVSNAVNGTAGLSGGTITFTPTSGFVGQGNFVYTVSDGRNTATASASVTVNPPVDPTQNQILLSPTTNLSSSSKDVVIGGQTFDSTINIPNSVTNATLNLSNVTTISGSTKTATLSNNITLSADTTLGTLTVQIPAGIQIAGNAISWDTGKINIPTIQSNSTVSPPAASGFTSSTSSVVEIGFGDVPLTFDKGVRVLIAGQAGKLVGYDRGGVFTQITNTCSADSQTVGDGLATGGDCYINVGADLIIWTKHFTKFATYTQTASSSTSSSSSSSSSGGSDGGDGLGCATHDCSGVHPASPTSTATGFTPGVLGITSDQGNVGIGENGQVKGEATASANEVSTPTPEPQTSQASSPFNMKAIAIVAIILLLGISAFRLLIR